MKNTMKTYGHFWLALLLTVATAGTFTSCTDYQDEIDALKFRVTVLEELVKQVNYDIASLQTVVEAVEDGDYITNVTNYEGGYIITFAKRGAIIVNNGQDGKDGEDGQDGKDGADGKDGKNGKDGNSVFESVRIVQKVDGTQYVEFVLKGSGVVFTVPLYQN